MDERIVEIDLPNGATALARISPIGGEGAEKVAAMPRFDFEDVTRTVEGIAAAIDVARAKITPKSVTVEFGLELGLKHGKLVGLLIEGEGRGSLKVTLEWSGEERGE